MSRVNLPALLLLLLLLARPTDGRLRAGGGGRDTGGGECPHSSGTVSGDRRGDARSLTFATFNTEWTFDGIDDPSKSPRAGNPANARVHLNAVAKVIAELDADVVNLVEVEGCGTLRQLVAAATAANPVTSSDYRPYLIQGLDTALGQQVGLLTRVDPMQDLWRSDRRVEFPLPGSSCNYVPKPPKRKSKLDEDPSSPSHASHSSSSSSSSSASSPSPPSSSSSSASRSTGTSKHYFARIRVGRKNVTVAGVHFKAMPIDPASCSKREAQAAVVAAELRRMRALGDEIVVMGDLNDFSDLHSDASGSRPVSRVLSMLRDLDGDGEDELEEMMGRVQPESERYTAWWDHAPKDGTDQGGKEHSQLDHVLVSKGLLAGGGASGAAAVVEVRVHHGEAAGAVSDHWPMVVKISFPPGVFTGEETTWTEYWTRRRLWRLCLELVFGVVFFTGVFALARGVKGPPAFVDCFFGFGMGFDEGSEKPEKEKKQK